MCEGRKEHGESKLGEVGTKDWELLLVYCLEEIEEENSGQERGEDGQEGESESELRGKTGDCSTAALAMSQFKWLCRQLAVDQPLGGELVHRAVVTCLLLYLSQNTKTHLSCKQDSPLSLCIRNLLAAPALLAALGWDVWEEVLSCKTEVLKLKFVKTKSLPTFCYCWAQSVSTRDDVRAVSPSCLCLSSVWECLCSHFCSGHYHQPPEQRSLGEVLVCVLGSSDRFKSPSSSSDSCAYH